MNNFVVGSRQWQLAREQSIARIRAAITKQELIAAMREYTGAGMMDCSDAYNAAEGIPDIMCALLRLNGTQRQFNRQKESIQAWYARNREFGVLD